MAIVAGVYPAISSIRFRVLGPVELVRDDTPLPLGGSTMKALLAGLLTSPNRIVPVTRIFEWLWDDRQPDHPRAALHNGISRLRGLVGADLLSTHEGGYCLRTDAGSLDLLRFDRLWTSARDAAGAGASADAMRALDDAVGLWQEPLLSNVESAALREQVVPRLTERYLAAVEERAALYMKAGRPDVVARDLASVVARHPFRERLVGQLMAALARTGRRAEALGAYTALRRLLRDELGIDPCADLQNLLVKILNEEPFGRRGRERA